MSYILLVAEIIFFTTVGICFYLLLYFVLSSNDLEKNNLGDKYNYDKINKQIIK